uniref:VP7 n=1 Tax=viral metagenome TaxID=1070528 RepID=A0A2V0RCE3_9ZZZZ
MSKNGITHSRLRKLKQTSRRAMVGAIRFSDSKTTLDPGGHMMYKSHSRIFNVNMESFDNMLNNTDMSVEEGIAHIELISSLPVIKGRKISQLIENKRPTIVNLIEEETEILTFANSWHHSWEQVIKAKNTFPPVFWTKDRTEVESSIAKKFPEANRLDPKKYLMIAYDKYDTYDKILKRFIEFMSDNIDANEVHLWTQGTLNEDDIKTNYDKMLSRLQEDFKIYKKANLDILSKKEKQPIRNLINRYWTNSVLEARDMYDKYTNLDPPRRIPVIGCRVCNWGMKSYIEDHIPQMVPSSTLHHSIGIKRNILLNNVADERYINYTSHCKIREIMPNEIGHLDFSYAKNDDGYYILTEPREGTFVVDNAEFFNGFSSVCTSSHSMYGFGRTPGDLLEQALREDETGHGTSGHMIASCLMFRAHVLLYLNDIHYNHTTQKTIYNLEVNEPTSGRYHSNKEYEHAVKDIKTLMKNTNFGTRFARNNLSIIEPFVSSMN